MKTKSYTTKIAELTNLTGCETVAVELMLKAQRNINRDKRNLALDQMRQAWRMLQNEAGTYYPNGPVAQFVGACASYVKRQPGGPAVSSY
jgi:hypothetical protein